MTPSFPWERVVLCTFGVCRGNVVSVALLAFPRPVRPQKPLSLASFSLGCHFPISRFHFLFLKSHLAAVRLPPYLISFASFDLAPPPDWLEEGACAFPCLPVVLFSSGLWELAFPLIVCGASFFSLLLFPHCGEIGFRSYSHLVTSLPSPISLILQLARSANFSAHPPRPCFYRRLWLRSFFRLST